MLLHSVNGRNDYTTVTQKINKIATIKNNKIYKAV